MRGSTVSARAIPRRPGFTLVEMLVAIAIIGVLVGLLLPAVQQVRETARRMQCRNNLKQLCLALHNYHETHGMFPINYGNGPYDDTNTGASWMQMILPQLDQSTLYERIRFGRPLHDPENRQVAKTPVSVWFCPSDSTHSQPLMDGRSNVPGVWAVNNYVACSGSNWNRPPFGPIASQHGRNAGNPDGLDHCNGFMCRGGDNQPTVTRFADLTDGSGTTFAVGESVPLWTAHVWWYWFNGVTATCAIPLNHKREPEDRLADWHEHNGFKSRHSGGAHFAMCDGHVRFVSDRIDLAVYRALATIQGGETITTF
ncbi:MAG: DUF1559 domain-containing protein [Planctomycetota bacterium]|nr:MAG: DUF1559 domain-containing protein [Planctomycetota bacterium]